MDIKYSRIEFDGYTHRFIVRFETGEPHTSNLTIYSNSESYKDLENFINEKKTNKVITFSIVHRATKEQDEHASKFLNEIFLKDI